MREFINISSQLKLNLPLCVFLLQVPKYERHLRDMTTKKDKLHDASTHMLGEECSALLMKKSVLHVDRALADLGTNINVISSTLFLDKDEEVEFPIFLGFSFLRTSRALIDMEKEKLVLRVGGNEIVFKLPLLQSPLSKVQDTEKVPRKGKERPKKDEKGRQLPSKVKAKFMKWVPVWQVREAKVKKDLDDRSRLHVGNISKWSLNDQD
ncbi:hypothetical protein M9H77_04591 [Catharanthus roseus]|uniref:Uncharacterized protein n=1 Tax=Catharanthus roseus TaxID=4058 RepID=A0ACC0CEF9_CATRO|nr:hypothetical protein M9H77_04591 [Catharanthus roseus]